MTDYEAPRLTRVGTLQELTLSMKHKYYSATTDYIYPDNLKFNFSGGGQGPQ